LESEVLSEIDGALARLTHPKPDVLLIVPPFGGIDRPALGPHILQAVAASSDFKVSVLYANLVLARELGIEEYENICYAPTSDLLGEACFSEAAFGDNAPRGYEIHAKRTRRLRVIAGRDEASPAAVEHVRTIASRWCDHIAAAVCRFGPRIVGCTTTFEQTCASLSLLNRIKKLDSSIITIIGGANCEGEMAHGIASIKSSIDHIFSGESEGSFAAFLKVMLSGQGRAATILHGDPNFELDTIPTPEYTEYYSQVAALFPNNPQFTSDSLWLPYESSRGCWWGQKHHCTFCGINGQGMAFRQKTPDRVIEELQHLTKKHPSNKVVMVDNIMPHNYFSLLLPRMQKELPNLHLFYEQKANLSPQKVDLLRKAGVAVIQPGIEALSTDLLKFMKKGVTASQNIALLRYAVAANMAVNWNMLFGFPGDRAKWYLDTQELISAISHLQPPNGLYRLSIDRFSPYFKNSKEFGIDEIVPMTAYTYVFPSHSDLSRIAYHFEATYQSESLARSDVIDDLARQVYEWRMMWDGDDVPKLTIARLSEEVFAKHDTRPSRFGPEFEFIDRTQAQISLTSGSDFSKEAQEWAADRRVCITIDGRNTPLATSSIQLLLELRAADAETLVRNDGPILGQRNLKTVAGTA
jgi:ribosomal peptide maturation radical SAM protein 1